MLNDDGLNKLRISEMYRTALGALGRLPGRTRPEGRRVREGRAV